MQRLFSTFPNGSPGLGLLLLRLCLGMALLYCAAAGLLGRPSELTGVVQQLMDSAGGIFLLAGLWTPAMGSLAALAEVWTAFLLHSAGQRSTWEHIFLAALSTSVAMLGPGAWSIDARLFGRKRIEIGRAAGRKPYP